MEALPGLFLGLSTGALGDSDQPIDLVGDGGGGPSSSGAGPSGSGDRNLQPPTDSDDDSDFEELSRDQFRAALAGRLLACCCSHACNNPV